MMDLPECPLGDLERRLAQTEGFTVTDHVVQLYGYCRTCAEKRRDGSGGETTIPD